MTSKYQSIPDLDRKGLREFGLLFGGVFAGLFGLLFPWLFDRPMPKWPWLLLTLMVLWSLMAPLGLRPLYRAWMSFGLLMSRFTTPLLMAVVFYVAITPMGLIRRLFAEDPMQRDWDTNAKTYRKPSEQLDIERLKRPF